MCVPFTKHRAIRSRYCICQLSTLSARYQRPPSISLSRSWRCDRTILSFAKEPCQRTLGFRAAFRSGLCRSRVPRSRSPKPVHVAKLPIGSLTHFLASTLRHSGSYPVCEPFENNLSFASLYVILVKIQWRVWRAVNLNGDVFGVTVWLRWGWYPSWAIQWMLLVEERRWIGGMLRRRGTYTVNADPDSRFSRASTIEPASIVHKKTGTLDLLVTRPSLITPLTF